MKILMIFIDMLRPNLLNVVNSAMCTTELDATFQRWGGSIYNNCYTPAPDTPRSNGCLWSSRYPQKNGCNTRVKYPAFYMAEPQKNFLTLFQNSCYTLNFYMHEKTQQIGELPIEPFPDANYSNGKSLQEYLQTLKIEENSITYFSLEDYHAVITDRFGRPDSHRIGAHYISGALREIENALGLDTFDVTVVFSDHGWRMSTEKSQSMLQQLGDNRTNVFLLIREKENFELKKKEKLCSIMDIGPTLCTLAGIEIPYETDGISLFDDKKTIEYILMEDHRKFNVTLEQTIEFWGAKTKKGLVCVDCAENWESTYQLSQQEKKYWRSLFCEKTSFFVENTKATKILRYYQETLESNPRYYDGTLRKAHPTWVIKIKRISQFVFKPILPYIRKILN